MTLGGRRCRSSARGCGRPMARARCRWRRTSISPIVTSSAGWRWSGSSPASPLASTVGCRSRSASRPTTRERSTSKSSVSRAFVQRTRESLWHLMSRPLADLRLAVVMLDGIEIKGRTNIVALGITTEGEKLALGLWAGSTENATVASALLSDLVVSRPGRRAGTVVRDRRLQGAAQGDPAGVRRRRAGAALRPPQGAKRARASARTRPPADQASAHPGVEGDRPRPRARAAQAPRGRARPRAPRRRRLARERGWRRR